MTVRQLKAFPNKPPAPAPEPGPRCEDTVNTYSDHDLAWRKNRYGEAEPLRCTRQAVVEIGGVKLCRLHGGHKVLDMYIAGELVEK